MNEFWQNISRYPRFLISSLIGSLLIIISPFKNLFKIKKFRITLILTLIVIFALLVFILRSMLVL